MYDVLSHVWSCDMWNIIANTCDVCVVCHLTSVRLCDMPDEIANTCDVCGHVLCAMSLLIGVMCVLCVTRILSVMI